MIIFFINSIFFYILALLDISVLFTIEIKPPILINKNYLMKK